MTQHLGAADLRRNKRIGMTGLSATEGMALLDATLGAAGTFVAAKLDVPAPAGGGGGRYAGRAAAAWPRAVAAPVGQGRVRPRVARRAPRRSRRG